MLQADRNKFLIDDRIKFLINNGKKGHWPSEEDGYPQ
jgi:hypothetical protein